MNNPKTEPIKVAAIQQRCGPDLEHNQSETIKHIKALANQGAEVVCLQELFSSQYFCQTECHDHFELAETIPGPTTERFGKLAAELKIVLVVSLFEKRTAGIYHNSAVVLESDGSIAGHYRKMHIPDDPCFYEKFYFTPGDTGFRSFQTSKGNIGVCICWDQWFPEAARLTALAGAEILFYPTAIGWLVDEKDEFGESQRNRWQTMMRAHAIANGVFVVAPNRVGKEDNIEFWGSSFIADPYGEVIAAAGSEQEETLLADCDLSLIETARTHWPFLRDRRIDAYGDLSKRFVDETGGE